MTETICPPTILILLGETNTPTSELSAVAKSRCDLAVRIAALDPSIKIIPTGAFGNNFNVTNTPHGIYLTRYLVDNGMAEDRILPYTYSSYTLEDAIYARRMVSKINPKKLIVVTSDFHLERAKFIFYSVFPGLNIEFRGAESPLIEAKKMELLRREKAKLNKLKSDWIGIPVYGADENILLGIYNNSSEELKHYDSVSNIAVTALVLAFVFPYTATFNIPAAFPKSTTFIIGIFLVAIFYLFYRRFALFARLCRRTMQRLEQIEGVPGFSSNYLRVACGQFDPDKNNQAVFGTFTMVSLLFVVAELCLLATVFFLHKSLPN